MIAKVTFSQKIKSDVDYKTLETKLESSRGEIIEKYEIKEISLNSNLVLEIKLEIKENLENGKLTVKFRNPLNIRSVDDDDIYLTQETAIIEPISFYISPNEEGVKAAADSASSSLKVFLGASAVVSLPMAFVLLKIFQMIDFMVLFNVKHPRNLSLFLSILSQSALDDIPNLFKFLSDDSCSVKKARFLDEGISCQVFSDLGNYFVLFLGNFLLFLDFWRFCIYKKILVR